MALNCIVYQAFDKDKINECRYALLKYLSVYNLNAPDDVTIVIYTDQPSVFEAYSPYFENFKMNKRQPLSKWAFLEEGLSQFDSVLYCETNTYPVKAIEPLFEKMTMGKTYLLFQKKVSSNLQKGVKKLISDGKIVNNEGVQSRVSVAGIPKDHALINQLRSGAGTLGNNSADDRQIILMLSNQRTHFDGFIDYSELPEFSKLLNVFFNQNEEESIPNLVKLIHHLDVNQIILEKREFEKLPIHKKWSKRILGKGWSIKEYSKKL